MLLMFLEIIDFWFEDIDKSLWWAKNGEFDQLITARFAAVHAKAIQCELFDWRQFPEGRLAEIIVLDQFSRNMYRDSALAFANDTLALALAQEAIAVGADNLLTPVQNGFLYMPFMHSESGVIHELAVELYKNSQVQAFYDFEIKHQNIIKQFGRYPHRNSILCRTSSQAEIEFLKSPDSRF
jgi:uncharacterized protein (DUF924 family)